MPELDLIKAFTKPLNDLRIPYMVTGAVAVIVYGEPRLTHDIDLILEIKADQVGQLVRVFPSVEFYCPPIEVIKLEIKRPLRGHFNIIHHNTGLKADIYTLGSDELHQWGMSKRRRMELEGETIWVAPPEYVILRKLEYYREGRSEKHIRDVSSIVEVLGNQLDFDEIRKRVKKLGLSEEWEQVGEGNKFEF